MLYNLIYTQIIKRNSCYITRDIAVM